jgi:hypothetical protein
VKGVEYTGKRKRMDKFLVSNRDKRKRESKLFSVGLSPKDFFSSTK